MGRKAGRNCEPPIVDIAEWLIVIAAEALATGTLRSRLRDRRSLSLPFRHGYAINAAAQREGGGSIVATTLPAQSAAQA